MTGHERHKHNDDKKETELKHEQHRTAHTILSQITNEDRRTVRSQESNRVSKFDQSNLPELTLTNDKQSQPNNVKESGKTEVVEQGLKNLGDLLGNSEADKKKSLEEKHNLKIEASGDKYTISRKSVDGTRDISLSVEKSAQGLNKLENILRFEKDHDVEIRSGKDSLEFSRTKKLGVSERSTETKADEPSRLLFTFKNTEESLEKAETLFKISNRIKNAEFRVKPSTGELQLFQNTNGKDELVTTIGDNSAGIDKANGVADFMTKHGIEIRSDNYQYKFFLNANGERKELFTGGANSEGLEQANTELQKLVDDKKRYLEEKFNVRFGQAGEPYSDFLTKLESVNSASPKEYKTIEPELYQLVGLEEALKRSEPTVKSLTVPITIYFVDKSPGATGFYGGWNAASPYIAFYSPEIRDVATQKDAAANGNATNESDFESLAIHEIAHATQYRSILNSLDYSQYDEMGWVPCNNVIDKAKGGGWLIKTSNGEFYKREDSGDWTRTTENGTLLNDEQGQPVVKNSAQIREMAVVRPISDYFDNPREMQADSLMAYRAGRDWQKKLYDESPALYKMTKKWDQQELDEYYGLDKQGNSKRIRNFDGDIVENTEENRKNTLEHGAGAIYTDAPAQLNTPIQQTSFPIGAVA
ncbi:hypothetical protein BH10CYA1_BH10CYA1_32590 [soil metagenome]